MPRRIKAGCCGSFFCRQCIEGFYLKIKYLKLPSKFYEMDPVYQSYKKFLTKPRGHISVVDVGSCCSFSKGLSKPYWFHEEVNLVRVDTFSPHECHRIVEDDSGGVTGVVIDVSNEVVSSPISGVVSSKSIGDNDLDRWQN